MGQFSFMFADKNNMENITHMEEAYVLLPNGAEPIHARYDLYGHFNRFDIYDLVVDMNRKHITEEMLGSLKSTPWKSDHISARLISQGYTDEQIKKELAKSGVEGSLLTEWKRNLGISISCYDEDNAALTYPIKITKEPASYDAVPPSKGDPTQGCEKIAFEVKSTLEKTVESFIRFEDAMHCEAWEKTPEEIIAKDLGKICSHMNYLGYSYDIYHDKSGRATWQLLANYEKDLFRAVDLFENIHPFRLKVSRQETEAEYGAESHDWNLEDPSQARTIREGIDGRYPAKDIANKIAWERFVEKRMTFPECEIAEKWLKENVLPEYRNDPFARITLLTKNHLSYMYRASVSDMKKSIQKKIDSEQKSRGYEFQKERFAPMGRTAKKQKTK